MKRCLTIVVIAIVAGVLAYVSGQPTHGERQGHVNESLGDRLGTMRVTVEEHDGQLFFPLPVWEEVMGRLGWSVHWDDVHRTVTMRSSGRYVTATYGVPVIERNGYFEPHPHTVQRSAHGTPLVSVSLFQAMFGHDSVAIAPYAKDTRPSVMAEIQLAPSFAGDTFWPPIQQAPSDALALVAHLDFLQLPIAGAGVDLADTHFVGAPRGYRHGIHQGFDFYAHRIGVPLSEQTPVQSMATGVVIRADHHWQTPSAATHGQWISQSENAGTTPLWILDLLRGRQVWVAYENGVMVRYAHLSSVRSDLTVGQRVVVGDILGTVGSSGTSGERDSTGLHLHIDIVVYGQLPWLRYTATEQRSLLSLIL